MKFISIAILPFLTSCGALNSDFFKAADDVLTNGVICVQVDKEAFESNREVEVNVHVAAPVK